jgi:NADPH:quinone reductase
MKAALYESTGPAAEVLRVTDVDRPAPGPGEVLVRVAVSGVNPTDWKSRAGTTPRPIDGFQIPHQDGAGVIEEVGEDVDPVRRGQRVWLWFAAAGRRFGTAAQWTVVPERQAVPLPGQASLELGASLGVPAMTAHWCLFSDGPVAGKTVLVAGGAGAVGHFAVELAALAGARVVATASNDEKAALARAAGAAQVVNYRDPGAAGQIREETGPVDRVIEVDLGANLGLDLAVLRPGGTIVTYAAAARDPELPVRACMTANVLIRFVLLYGVPAAGLDAAVAGISAALAEAALTGLPVQRFELAQIAAAHEAAENGPLGKVLVVPPRPDPGPAGVPGGQGAQDNLPGYGRP